MMSQLIAAVGCFPETFGGDALKRQESPSRVVVARCKSQCWPGLEQSDKCLRRVEPVNGQTAIPRDYIHF
jgi:hypothetical protein